MIPSPRTGLILTLLLCSLPFAAPANLIVIRVNGLGYASRAHKTAIVVSDSSLAGRRWQLFTAEGDHVLSGDLSADLGLYLDADHHYRADFSRLRDSGRYYMRVDDVFSPPVLIEPNPYATLPDSILHFFQVQRCGDTDPSLHDRCHLHDATYSLREWDNARGRVVEAAGGWHDAGDYTKFTLTAAQAAYFLVLAHAMHPDVSPDRDGNGRPDVLDEARIGLDWLVKIHPAPDRFYIQVQDHRDHSVGWRMPSEDPLALDRPAFGNASRAICGMYAAALALGSDVFQQQGEREYAATLLDRAASAWRLAENRAIPNISSGPDSMYFDRTYHDNLTLGAVELYRATGKAAYLDSARVHLAALEPRAWLSWGDLDNFALARMAEFDDEALVSTGRALAKFQKLAEENPYGFPLPYYPWGSATVQMGVAALAILHSHEVGGGPFLPLAVQQADFVTGMNSHGVSFIVGVGRQYPRRIHHQVAYLTGAQLTGALVGGFVRAQTLDELDVPLERRDRYRSLQSEEAVYRDDRFDYVSNEPTVAGNALAYFVFSWFASRGVPNVVKGAGRLAPPQQD